MDSGNHLPTAGRVLYIEDNPTNLRLMQCWADQVPGLELLIAETGQTGIEVFERVRPDAVILDMHLPDLPGAEVLRRLLAAEGRREVPIALLTGDAAAEDVRAAIKAGASAYWIKPVDFSRLHRELGDLLRRAERPD
ncbi:response regulator [Roseateles noduli]|uniref:response regulator n=1 Tax=Roseateles noduli TaxID=2052484 RepID=UPI003D64F349